MKNNGFIGRRIIKTGIAVFLTAIICLKLNLPAEFAIIAAIVTIEPTASDSIRKGFIRLPASAIGAALAVIFVALWGENALSYTFAAVLTIFACQKLKLYDGILVATLTAVAMVPDIHGSFFLTFLTRLGTTSIGLIVSSSVNFFILPPKFTPLIKEKLFPNFQLASEVLNESINNILAIRLTQVATPSKNYQKLRQSIEKVSELISFQQREWKYHKMKLSEYRNFQKLKKANIIMQKIVLHLGNLQYINQPTQWSTNEKQLILNSLTSIQCILEGKCTFIPDEHYLLIHELDLYLKNEANLISTPELYFHHFTSKRILYFELLSIHDSIEELVQINVCKEKVGVKKDLFN